MSVWGKPDKSDLYVEVEGDFLFWPFCIMPWCRNRICIKLSSVYCFPHSCEGQNIEPHFPAPWLTAMLRAFKVLP